MPTLRSLMPQLRALMDRFLEAQRYLALEEGISASLWTIPSDRSEENDGLAGHAEDEHGHVVVVGLVAAPVGEVGPDAGGDVLGGGGVGRPVGG